MKPRYFLTFAMVCVVGVASLGLAGCSGSVTAQDQPVNVVIGNQQTGIAVTGEGSKTVTPDIATLSLGVSSRAATVAEAQAKAAVAMDNIMKALTSNGVASKDIQTQYYSIYQETRWDDKTQDQVVTGYVVSNTVTAKIRALDKAGTTIDAVAAAGGDETRVNGISFSVENPEKYYEEVRELAVKDAKAKAEQMARLAGVTLGKATFITESVNYQPYPVPYYKGAAYDMASSVPTTAISAGETEATLNVQITYAIQ